MRKRYDLLAAEIVQNIINNEGIPHDEVIKTSVEKTLYYNFYIVSVTYKSEMEPEFTLRAKVYFDNTLPRVIIDIYNTEGDPSMRCCEILNGDVIDEYTGEVLAKTE